MPAKCLQNACKMLSKMPSNCLQNACKMLSKMPFKTLAKMPAKAHKEPI
jgi:hypothetical protein